MKNKTIHKILKIAFCICAITFFFSIYYSIITYDKMEWGCKVFVLSPITALVIAIISKFIITEEMD